MLCPDHLVNANQIKPLLDYSATPFYCLTVRENFQPKSNYSTPKKRQRTVARTPQTQDKKGSAKRTLRSRVDTV
jgi:hypothetical protein